MANSEGRRPWQRVLYLRQGYEDSYTDPSLNLAVVNANVRHYEFTELCGSALAVVQQLSVLAVFVGLGEQAQSGAVSPRQLLSLVLGLAAAGLALRCILFGGGICAPQQAAESGCPVLGPGLGAIPRWQVSFLWMATPKLWCWWSARGWDDGPLLAAVGCLLALHLLLHDYRGSNGWHGAWSQKAATAAAALLASRIPTAFGVAAFLGLALELFTILPELSEPTRRQAPETHGIVITLPLTIAAVAAMGSGASRLLLVSVLATVVLLGPGAFLWAHRYKARMEGPWDLAHVRPAPVPASVHRKSADSLLADAVLGSGRVGSGAFA